MKVILIDGKKYASITDVKAALRHGLRPDDKEYQELYVELMKDIEGILK